MKTARVIASTLAAAIALLTAPFSGRALTPLVRTQWGAMAAAPDGQAARLGEALAGPAGLVQPPRSSPVMFVENVGQFDAQVRFQMRGVTGTVWLTPDAVWIVLPGRESSGETEPGAPGRARRGPESDTRRAVAIELRFAGAAPEARLEPFGRLDTVVSYFVGADPDRWRAAVPAWGGLRYAGLYPGVDLEIAGQGDHWGWRLQTRAEDARETPPGAPIRLHVRGADQLSLEPPLIGDAGPSAGSGGAFSPQWLRLTTALGDVAVPLPQGSIFSAAEPDAERPGGWTLEGTFSDAVWPSAPQAAALADDAAGLIYATFLGGTGWDEAAAIAIDASGAAYITGRTDSAVAGGFPATPGAFDGAYHGNTDALVAKLNPAGSALEYATYMGGQQGDYGHSIAVDSAGAAYVTGVTRSADFPTTAGAFDATHNGDDDVFVAKLSPTGSALTYSTFLGGSQGDYGYAISTGPGGAAYLTGNTYSTEFPSTPGAFDPTFGGIAGKGFVVKLNATGSGLAYATFLTGSIGYGLTVSEAGVVYLTGQAFCDFPATWAAYDMSCNGGGADAFVAKISPTGSELSYATFVGGGGDDYGRAIALGGDGAVYITGSMRSGNFPTTPGAFDTTNNGEADAFVVKLNPVGSGLGTGLHYATFLGARMEDWGSGIAVDSGGSAYVAGGTTSDYFPTTSGAYDTTFNGFIDVFAAKLNPAGSQLSYSSFLGGKTLDEAHALAVDGGGAVYLAGLTRSSDFPTTEGAFDRTGFSDECFVVKMEMDGAAGPTSTPSPTATAPTEPTPTPTSTSTATPTSTPSATPAEPPPYLPAYLPLLVRGESCTPTPTRTATATPTTTPSDGMIYIPAGEFQMGCDASHANESCSPRDTPLHPVYLDAYWIDSHEVSNAQYAECVAAAACDHPTSASSYTRYLTYYGSPDYAGYPVVYVDWHRARQYCAWKGGQLPTEAQWEKAARGSDNTRLYAWGNQPPDCTRANFWHSTGTCVGDTAAAGSYPLGASPYGVLDMAGNVQEWVADWYWHDYYTASPYRNPTGPATGTYRTVRGGSFLHRQSEIRTAYRNGIDPDDSTYSLGFRCAAPAPAE